jgi:hypothetical protein
MSATISNDSRDLCTLLKRCNTDAQVAMLRLEHFVELSMDSVVEPRVLRDAVATLRELLVIEAPAIAEQFDLAASRRSRAACAAV